MPSTLPRFDFKVEYAASSDPGRVRAQNEDAWAIAPELAAFVLSDGMGGHDAGDVASRIAVDAVVDALGTPLARATLEKYGEEPSLSRRHGVFLLLRQAFEKANAAVRAEAVRRESERGMGATLDAAVLVRDRAFVAHSGDARVYLARASTFIQLTHDHALHDSLVAQGTLPPRHPRPPRDPLLNAIGLASTPGVDTVFVEVTRGDRLLLCSDGVHHEIGNEATIAQLLRGGPPEDAARALVDHANRRGGRDNATAVVVQICERFVARPASDSAPDSGPVSSDIVVARHSPLLDGLPMAQALSALAAAVEVEIRKGERVPRMSASDLVAYIVVSGMVALADGRVLGPSGLVFPESLLGVARDGELPVVSENARLMRLRADDFAEVCSHDLGLSNALHVRLARHLARGR